MVALESSLFVPVSRRRELHRWPAMEVLGAATEAHLGFALTEIGPVEIYSCFPAAIRVQQRALRSGQKLAVAGQMAQPQQCGRGHSIAARNAGVDEVFDARDELLVVVGGEEKSPALAILEVFEQEIGKPRRFVDPAFVERSLMERHE